MSGSGNDFVFFDARARPHPDWLRSPDGIQKLCDRRLGVGADGVVVLDPALRPASLRMTYYNSDGSRASMCGNAALCATRLATELGGVDTTGFRFVSDAGVVDARLRDGLPEVDLAPLERLEPALEIAPVAGERQIGFAVAGVPHLVVLCDDVDAVAIGERGAALRRHPVLGDAGANANFVSRGDTSVWRMRTFERGVEDETLACGTGAVACAAVLRAWGLADDSGETAMRTSSGRDLLVTFAGTPDARPFPSLRGEGRIVFAGELGDL